MFYVFFKRRDEKTELTDMIKHPEKGEENRIYKYLSAKYYNSTKAFTREHIGNKDNAHNIISDLNKVIKEIRETNSTEELAQYLEENYGKPERLKGRCIKPDNYQNTATVDISKEWSINCRIYKFMTKIGKEPENHNISYIYDKWIDINPDDEIVSPKNLIELWFPSYIVVPKESDHNDPVWGSLPCKEETLKKYREESNSRFNSTFLRKTLVISYFFNYFVIKANKPEKKWRSFRDHMDERLEKCGFQKLYEGNPFDAIFLVSAEYGTSYDSKYMPKYLSGNKYPNICTLYRIWYKLLNDEIEEINNVKKNNT